MNDPVSSSYKTNFISFQRFDRVLCCRQLRYSGMMETIRFVYVLFLSGTLLLVFSWVTTGSRRNASCPSRHLKRHCHGYFFFSVFIYRFYANPAMDQHPFQGGAMFLVVGSRCRYRINLVPRPHGLFGQWVTATWMSIPAKTPANLISSGLIQLRKGFLVSRQKVFWQGSVV